MKGLIQENILANLNPHLLKIDCDNLYHINLKKHDNTYLASQFGDVKV
jgi:hypothetical protein